jgi:hypothetical protein
MGEQDKYFLALGCENDPSRHPLLEDHWQLGLIDDA